MGNLKDNVVIAKFMGYEEGFPHKTDKYGYHQCEEGFKIPDFVNDYPHVEDSDNHQFAYCDLKFDRDWNWLIPVVMKIKTMNLSSLKHIAISEALLIVDIDDLFDAVVSFIICDGKNI